MKLFLQMILTGAALLALLVPTALAQNTYASLDEDALAEADSVYEAMQEAESQEDYIEVLEQMRNMPGFRAFEATKPEKRAEMPRGADSVTTVYASADTVRYHNEVFYPRCREFFLKFAEKEWVKQFTFTLREEYDEYDERTGGPALNLAELINPIYRQESIGLSVLLIKPKVTSFAGMKAGDTVEAEVCILKMPEAYGDYLKSQVADFYKAYELHFVGRQDSHKLDIDEVFYRDNLILVFAGFSTNHLFNGNLQVGQNVYLMRAGMQPVTEVKAVDVDRLEFKQPLYKTYLQCCIALGSWLRWVVFILLPVMLVILVKEHLRRKSWQAGPGLAGGASALSAEAARSRISEFLSALPVVDIEGVKTPYYPDHATVRAGNALLAECLALPNPDAETQRLTAALTQGLEVAQKRYMLGRKRVMGLVILIFGLAAGCLVEVGHYGQALVWAACIPVYYLASLCPAYRYAMPTPWYCRAMYKIPVMLGVGAIVCAASLPVYKTVWLVRDQVGNWHKEVDVDDNRHIWILVVATLVALALPILMMAYAVCNFFRHYISRK